MSKSISQIRQEFDEADEERGEVLCRLYAGEMTVKTARKPEDATCREILTYLQDHFSNRRLAGGTETLA